MLSTVAEVLPTNAFTNILHIHRNNYDAVIIAQYIFQQHNLLLLYYTRIRVQQRDLQSYIYNASMFAYTNM